MFKMLTTDWDEKQKINAFGGYVGPKAIEWFTHHRFSSWSKLEKAFKASWCDIMTPTEALAKVMHMKQKEDEHIRIYASEFKDYMKFFEGMLTLKGCCELFLQKASDYIRRHMVEIMSLSSHNWDEFISKVILFDLIEP